MTLVAKPALKTGRPPVRIKNVSGGTIPARSFALITNITGGVFEVDQVDTDVVEPSRLVATGPAEIADEAYSIGFPCSDGAVWIKYNSTAPTEGRYFGPVNGQWYGQLNYFGFVVHEVSGNYAKVGIEKLNGVYETTAAGGGGTVKVKRVWVDGTVATPELTVGYLTDEDAPASGVKGRLLSVVGAPNTVVFVPFGAGGGFGTHSSPATVGTTAETEAAQTDTWDQTSQGANDGVNVVCLARIAYDNTSARKLYGFYRNLKFDSNGLLYEIGAESRVEIDAAEPAS